MTLGDHKYNIGQMVRVPDYSIERGIIIGIQYHLGNYNEEVISITYDIWYYDEYFNKCNSSFLESHIIINQNGDDING